MSLIRQFLTYVSTVLHSIDKVDDVFTMSKRFRHDGLDYFEMGMISSDEFVDALDFITAVALMRFCQINDFRIMLSLPSDEKEIYGTLCNKYNIIKIVI